MKIGHLDIAIENKALILLSAKASKKEHLIAESKQVAAGLLQRMDSQYKKVAVMVRFDMDPFRLASKAPGYDVTIELRADAEYAAFAAALEGIANALPSAHSNPSASVVLVGSDYLFRPCPPKAVRFQYLMRRRQDLTHQAYAKHYAEIHSGFGFKTRGVEGYAQLHVDPFASAEAAKLSGFETCDFDGVSQLYMTTLTKFLLASPVNAAMGMIKDEKRFVDRDNSAMFSSRVVTSLS
jgi:EthD domain